MKPRSVLCLARSASSFFASSASEAESVRDRMIISSELSTPMRESAQPRTEAPFFSTHPDRRSLEAPTAVDREPQLPPVNPLFTTQDTGSRASGRRDTEYMSAAREDTA